MKKNTKKEVEVKEVKINDSFVDNIIIQLDKWDGLTADLLECQLIIGRIGSDVKAIFIKELDEKRYKGPFGEWRENKFGGRLDSRKMSYCIRLYDYSVKDSKTFKAVLKDKPQLTSAERIIKECNAVNNSLKSKQSDGSKTSKPRVKNILTRLNKCLDDIATAHNDADVDGGYGFSLESLAEVELIINKFDEFKTVVPEYTEIGKNSEAYKTIVKNIARTTQARMDRLSKSFGLEIKKVA